MSSVTAVHAGYLVADSAAAAGTVGGVGGALLVAGSALSPSALRSAVAQHAPGAAIVFRSRLLAGLSAAPLRHGAYLALLLGAAAAAVCGLLVLLISLLLSAAPRRRVLLRLRTMGMSTAQARLATFVELLPQLLAVLAGGAACALALVPVLGPALNLAGFTGSAAGVPIQLEPGWLAITAVALLVLVLAVLTGQTTVTGHETPRSLEKGEWGQP
jgi:putative ABC transport system permease protein